MNVRQLSFCAVLVAAVWQSCDTGRAASISLTPACDGSYDLKSGELRLDSVSLLAYNGQPTGYNWRAAIEFDLASIPAHATIQNAVFRIRYNGASGTHAETLKFCQYTGNGTIEPADFSATTQIGPLYEAFGPPADTKPFYHIPATDFVQSLVDSEARFAGFTAQNVVWNQTALYSHWGGPSYTPRLEIDYAAPVPEPGSAALLAAGLAAAAWCGWRRRAGHRTAENK